MERPAGKMDRLRNLVNTIREEEVEESEIDELCEILNKE